MDSEILKMLNQRVVETRKLADEAKRQADEAWEGVKEIRNQTTQLRELVIISKNEMLLLTRPWWKKLFGTAS